MNRTRLLMIGILAVVLGLCVSVLVYRNLQSRAGAGNEQQAAVMVAANDLQVGAKIEQRDIRVIHVPVSDFPAGAPQRYADVVGHGVILPNS